MGSLHDAYELGGVAGHGRATVVRLGVRRGDASPVALKQLRIDHAQDPARRRRFVQQARRATMLQHESIETMLDVVDGRDGPVAVAEWVDGRSLERLATRRRRNDEPWTAEEVVVVARALLEALQYAHHQPTAFDAQGMLHGGLWPGNVLVDVEGHVKVVDFGMAAVWQEASEPWQDLESLRYLSAEHVRHGATAASDLFAVGAIVHELLSGCRFRAEHQTEAEMRCALERVEPPETPREDVPAALERLRRRLLEPIQNPGLEVEHMLDLCAAIPIGDGRASLRHLVRDTLRNESTAPEPDTPPRGTPRLVGPELGPSGGPKTRTRSSAAVHVADGGRALGIALQQVPLGQKRRKPRRSETPSMPEPGPRERAGGPQASRSKTAAPASEVERERAGAPRASRSKTAAPASEVERERSDGSRGSRRPDEGSADAAAPERSVLDVGLPKAVPSGDESSGPAAPQELVEADTAPLPIGAAEVAVPEPIDAPDDEPEPLSDLGVTAEISRPARLPEDRDGDVTHTHPIVAEPSPRLPRWLRGPVGWALLGAAAVGIGVPLAARCSATDEPSPPAKTSRR